MTITDNAQYVGQAFGDVVVKGAFVAFTDCTFKSLSVVHGAVVDLAGTTNITGGTGNDGLAVLFNGHVNLMGPLSVSGSVWGIHIGYHSRVVCFTPNCNVTVSGASIGCQLGLSGVWQHRGPGSTINLSGSSVGVQCTDQSSWSTDQTVIISGFKYAFDLNSISYLETTGPRSINTVSGLGGASQNSVIWLP